MVINYLLEVTFEINLFTLIAFLTGLVSGAIILVLVYAIGCINTLKKDSKVSINSIKGVNEEAARIIINNHRDAFKDEIKRRKEVSVDAFKETIFSMMNEIASKFYPKSKRPLSELSIDELILLNKYILSKLEEILSKPIIKAFRGVKLSHILLLIETKNNIDKNKVVKTVKKYKLQKVGEAVINIVGILNPAKWFKKLIIDPTTNLLLKQVLLTCIDYIGEETYKVYSKTALKSTEDELEKLIEVINKDKKEITLSINQVTEEEI